MRQIITKNFKFGLWYVFSAITCCLIFIGVADQIYDVVKKHFELSFSSPRTDWVIPLIYFISGIVAFFASWILYKRKFGAAVAFWLVTFVLVVQIVIFAVLKEEFEDDIEEAIIEWRISEVSEFSFSIGYYDYYFDEDKSRLYRTDSYGGGYYSFEEIDRMLYNPVTSYAGTGKISKVYATARDEVEHKFYFITTDGKVYASYDYDWL